MPAKIAYTFLSPVSYEIKNSKDRQTVGWYFYSFRVGSAPVKFEYLEKDAAKSALLELSRKPGHFSTHKMGLFWAIKDSVMPA
jgi:hypothetical protein